MKKMIFSLLCFIGLLNVGCKSSKPESSVSIAKKANDIKVSNGQVNKEAADFLVKIADARMMGKKEGELAMQKGTTKSIRKYGKLMVRDQELLLNKIKILAASKGIYLPSDIGNDKKDGFETLNGKEAKKFDEKFIKMMRIDHERDINDFTKAAKYSDELVAAFAAKYLPLIQSHLDKLNAIKE